MKIVIYANCQGGAIAKLIRHLWRGSREMSITIFENYKMIDGSVTVDTLLRAVSDADVFIYQPLAARYGHLSTAESTDGVVTALNARCVRIAFPYLYNGGYWPTFPDGDAFHNGAAVTRLFEDGVGLEEVLRRYDAGNLSFDIDARIEASCDILIERERDLDVKVGGLVREQGRARQLFLTQNHPSTALFAEVVAQIVRLIGSRHFGPTDGLNDLPVNFAELPCYWPIDAYCLNEGRLRFLTHPEEGASAFYRSVIAQQHQAWQAVDAAAVEAPAEVLAAIVARDGRPTSQSRDLRTW